MGLSLKPNEITFFTVPDTGIALPIRKVSVDLLRKMEKKVRAEMPEPAVPMQEVRYGDRVEYEANPAHPDYIRARDKWKQEFGNEIQERTQTLLIDFGIIPYVTLDDEEKERVAQYREIAEKNGLELDPDDRVVWVNDIALGTVEDLADLISAIMRRTRATEEAINEAVKKF